MKIVTCDKGRLVGLLVDDTHIVYLSNPDQLPETVGRPCSFQMCADCRIIGDTEQPPEEAPNG